MKSTKLAPTRNGRRLTNRVSQTAAPVGRPIRGTPEQKRKLEALLTRLVAQVEETGWKPYKTR